MARFDNSGPKGARVRRRDGSGRVLITCFGLGDFPSDPPDPRTQNHCFLKFNISSTMEAFDAALASLQFPESINYAVTTREFKYSETTLRRRH